MLPVVQMLLGHLLALKGHAVLQEQIIFLLVHLAVPIKIGQSFRSKIATEKKTIILLTLIDYNVNLLAYL